MPSQLELTPIDAAAVGCVPLLKQAGDEPVLRGSETPGETYLCPNCSRVLAESLADGAVWDVGFRCAGCGTASICRELPPGRPIPIKAVTFPPGEYLIGTTLEADDDVAMVGEPAVRRRTASLEGSRPKSVHLDADRLESHAARIEAVLGPSFAKLHARYRRGQSRSATPPREIHRLVELVALARQDAASFRAGEPALHLIEIIELDLIVSVLDRWQNDPCMPEMLASLKSANDVPHLLVTLGTAGHLTDARIPVGLVPPADNRRSPDLQIHIGSHRRLNVEVKAPGELVRRQEPLEMPQATEIVRKAATSAGTGAAGQLNPEHPGLLVIGGLHLGDDLAVLEQAARAVANERPQQRTHIAAIAAVSVGTLVNGVEWDQRGLRAHGSLTASGVFELRLAHNESYTGEAVLREVDGPVGPSRPWSAPAPVASLNAARASAKLGRNDACWCGSGKKFKRCHGG